MRQTSLAALAALALAACQQAGDENIAIDESNSLNADVEVLPPSEEGETPADNLAAAEELTPDSIASQYRGRWGLVAADCEPGRSDAKGLIVIDEGSVRFYESVATLKEQRPAVATSFSGLFAFTGEGQSWEAVMTFTRTANALKRVGEDGTFTYRLCN
ncbi:MAG TPA: hypothetical protein VNA29_05505 [Sphingomicrobium sp.]|nr:hypothetical protein [Sphingomicrobium sp.]